MMRELRSMRYVRFDKAGFISMWKYVNYKTVEFEVIGSYNFYTKKIYQHIEKNLAITDFACVYDSTT